MIIDLVEHLYTTAVNNPTKSIAILAALTIGLCAVWTSNTDNNINS